MSPEFGLCVHNKAIKLSPRGCRGSQVCGVRASGAIDMPYVKMKDTGALIERVICLV